MTAAGAAGAGAAAAAAVASRVRTRLSDRHAVRLTEQFAQLERQLLPELAQYESKRRLLRVVSEALARSGAVAAGAELRAFGSCANGLWTRGSDIDACLVIRSLGEEGRDERELWQSQLRVASSLMRRLRASGEDFGELSMVTGAKVPVLKAQDRGGRESLDISVNNMAALENSAAVEQWGQVDHRFRPLSRVVKHWASRRDINDRARGTLSTYTLILQVKHVLERGKPEAEAATPGELLREFFELFGSDEAREGVEIAEGVETTKSDEGVLVMRCPLTGKNVNPMTRSTWLDIHKEFRRARDLLRMHKSLFEICLPLKPGT